VEAAAWTALSALLYFYLMLLQLYIFPPPQQTAIALLICSTANAWF